MCIQILNCFRTTSIHINCFQWNGICMETFSNPTNTLIVFNGMEFVWKVGKEFVWKVFHTNPTLLKTINGKLFSIQIPSD